MLFPILYTMSDKKIILKEIKKKKKTVTKHKASGSERQKHKASGAMRTICETKSFGGQRLKIFQKQGDYLHSREDEEN